MIKTDDPNYVRDQRSTALLNTDVQGAERYKAERDRHIEMMRMQERMQTVENNVQDIRNMLLQLTTILQNGK